MKALGLSGGRLAVLKLLARDAEYMVKPLLITKAVIRRSVPGTRAAVSRHLQWLRKQGYIDVWSGGLNSRWRVTPSGLEALQIKRPSEEGLKISDSD